MNNESEKNLIKKVTDEVVNYKNNSKKEIKISNTSDDSLFAGLPSELVDQLTPAKNRLIMMYLTGMYTNNQIAKTIGVANNTISIWLQQPAVMAVIKELQRREFDVIDSKLKSMRYKALDTMDDLLDSPIDQVRYSVSKDILDRTGHKAKQEIAVDKTVTNIEQQLKDLSSFNINDADVIDITDFVDAIKDE